MSRSKLGCGAYQISVQGGWLLGLRCGREAILAKGETLAEAIENAQKREFELRARYQPQMGNCQQLVAVQPDGLEKIAPSIAFDSGAER